MSCYVFGFKLNLIHKIRSNLICKNLLIIKYHQQTLIKEIDQKKSTQLIVDAYGCKGNLDSETKIMDMLVGAAKSIGATIVKKDVHTYEPQSQIQRLRIL